MWEAEKRVLGVTLPHKLSLKVRRAGAGNPSKVRAGVRDLITKMQLRLRILNAEKVIKQEWSVHEQSVGHRQGYVY